MKNGWISLHRKTIQTDWYTNIPAKVLAIHLLLRANETPDTWHGVTIERGSFVTSRAHLSEETGLTQQQIRTALRVLTESGFCTVTATKQSSIITVCKFDEYQTPTRRRKATNDSTNKSTNDSTNAATGEKPEQDTAESGFFEIENTTSTNVATQKSTQNATTNNKYNNINISVVNDIKGENQDLNFISISDIPQLLDDEQYLSSVAFGKYITPEHVRELIPEFVNQLIASGETRKEIADAKKHFNNWIRKRADIERAERMRIHAQSNINKTENGNDNNQSGNSRCSRRNSGKSDGTGGKLHKPTNRGK